MGLKVKGKLTDHATSEKVGFEPISHYANAVGVKVFGAGKPAYPH